MYQYQISNHFKAQLKPYLKKFRSLIDDVIRALESFDKERSIYLGEHVYKLRMKASDLPRGKSHAFRLIIMVVEIDNLILPIILYFKGDKQTIIKKEILYHAKIILKEIEEEARAKRRKAK